MGNGIKIFLTGFGLLITTFLQAQSVRLNWKAIGPFETPAPDIDTGYVTPTGMGWIESVADAGEGVLYAGSNSGGLYKTTDGGKRWKSVKVSETTYGILDIQVEPGSNRLWVGTGTTVNEESYGIGILRSEDEGKTWQTTSVRYSPYHKRAVWQFKVLNVEREAIAAVTQNHVIYSEKGYEKPKDLFGGKEYQFRQLLVHPKEQKIWYASGSHLCISYNHGNDWLELNEKLISNHESYSGQAISRIAISLSPANPDYLWAAYQFNYVNYIQLSRDKGHSWEIVGTNRTLSRFDIHHAEIREDPKDSNVIYAGAVRMFVSTDRGKSFKIVSNPAWGTPSFMHDDIRALEFTKNGELLIGNDGGVSLSSDRGMTWISLNGKGLTVTQIYSMALHPKRKGDLIIGCQDLSSMKYFKGKWINTSRLYGDGGPCLYRDGEIPLAIISQNAMLLSSDNDGEGWNSLGNPQLTNKLHFPLINDPYKEDVFYAAWYNLWRKAGDEWWENLSDKVDGGGYAIQAVSVVSGEPFTGYLAFDQPAWKTGNDLKAKLFRGRQDGESLVWEDISANLGILSWSYIRAIATLPGDSVQVWVGLEGLNEYPNQNRVFYSPDGGKFWQDISGGLPNTSINKLMATGDKESKIWAATDEGMYLYEKGTWKPVERKLPKIIIRDFAISKDRKVMYAATYGAGVWKAKLKRKYR